MILRHRYDYDPAAGNQGHQMLTDVLVPDALENTVYHIVLKLQMNSEGSITTGNDLVSVWINPTNTGSEAAAGAPDATFIDFSLSASTNIDRMVFANSSGFASEVSYDEMRFGTTWEDVIGVVPEPGSGTTPMDCKL